MPYSRETDYFYKSFGDYTLYFYPAFNTGSRTTAYEFPDNAILNKVECNKSLPNNQFWGLQLANQLKIELEFANFTGDWVDVAQWIMQGKHDDVTISSSTYTELNSDQTVTNYNYWVLKDTSLPAAQQVIFSGFQSPNKERKLKPKNGTIKYELSLIGTEKIILENVKLNNLNISADNTYTDYLHDVAYNDSGDLKGFKSDKADYDLVFLSTLASQIDGYADAIFKETTRFTAGTAIFDLEFPNWTFYKQDITTSGLTGPKGAALTWSDLQVCISGNDEKVGLLSDNNESISNFQNAWSFLRSWCDYFLIKGVFNFDATGTPVIELYKPYETISSNLDISGADQAEYEIDLSPLTISQSTTTNIIKAQNDGLSIIREVGTGSQDEETENVESVLHNYVLNFIGTEGSKTINSADGPIKRNVNFTSRNIWYEDTFYSGITSAGKIHGHCILDMGDSVTFESDTSYLSETYLSGDLDKKIWSVLMIVQEKQRSLYYGMGRERNKALLNAFGNENHGIVTLEVGNYVNTSTEFTIDNLGETVTMDLSTLFNTILGELGSKAIVTGIEGDLINDTYNVSLFLR